MDRHAIWYGFEMGECGEVAGTRQTRKQVNTVRLSLFTCSLYYMLFLP
jgi:hypothetical protein